MHGLIIVCLVLAIVMLYCIVRKRETVSLNLLTVRKLTSGEVCWQVISSAHEVAVSYFGSDAVGEILEKYQGLAKEYYFLVHSDDSEIQLELAINASRFRVVDQQRGENVFSVHWQEMRGFNHFLYSVQRELRSRYGAELVAA